MRILEALRKPKPRAPETDELGNATVAVVPGSQLMAEHNRQAMIAHLQTLAGLSEEHFDRLYLDTLVRFAEYVQLMPASETHHHARLGGLLDHSLDVAHRALSLRRGHLLPPQGTPEKVGREADRWTFAVFAAALLHDVGKPAGNNVVELFDSGGRPLGDWNGLLGPMEGASRYRIRFRPARAYEDHTIFGPFVARAILPPIGLSWICEDLGLIKVWMSALAGDYDQAGPIGAIVKQADGLSVATDVGANTQALLPSASRMPLHDKLINGLRRLLDDGGLPINRAGAGAWCTETDVWMVSKRGLDAIRNRLTDEGHKDIPSRNERLMDILGEFGLCRLLGEKAIWKARILADDFDQSLTFLRFPIEVIWPDAERRPVPFAGQVLVDGEEEAEKPSAAGASRATHTVDPTPKDLPIDAAEPEPASLEELHFMRGPTQAPDTRPEDPEPSAVDEPPELAEPESFLRWLVEGITEELLEVNTSKAAVHVVLEGLLVVSPRIFKKYSGHDGPWGNVQKRFLKARLHRRNSSGNNIIEYRVSGGRKNSVIKGILITDPEEQLGVSLPEPNAHLTLITELM